MKNLFAYLGIVPFFMASFVAANATQPQPIIAADENHRALYETKEERDARMQWWRDAKFGMFIHYGLYSGLAGEWKGRPAGTEWIQKNVETDTFTYQKEVIPLFKPREKIAEEWADLAKEAGCQYGVLTSKHHEGFALFDSKQTEFNSVALFGRDFVKEFTDAFRSRGMRVGLYHSVIDWHHPDYDNTIQPGFCYPQQQAALLKALNIPRDQKRYQRYLHAQVREILTNYGKIDVIWWDYSQGKAEGERAWGAPKLIEMCHELQPGIIMNNRLYAFSGLDKSPVKSLDLRCGDYTTPEKHIPQNGYPGLDWESCMTVGDKWGYNRYDVHLKSVETVIRQLQECAGKGGNLLLNIGPKVDGSVPEGIVNVFRGVGAWMKQNGEAIYGTRAFYDAKDSAGKPLLASKKKNALYVFVPKGEDPKNLKVNINGKDYQGKLLADTICPVLKIVLE